ncbi:uncharacterized protein LOC132800547 [Ziziphus jujuba]|uniref:Uncharacterized protein LOC132800547 n=1 Tax=Ziziphus jujuba TaxID=326968 RepID=A0ABM4A162_ZIZJJ|nr:uncharacterized protein LOC132800547 [Ziziphus jujuba]
MQILNLRREFETLRMKDFELVKDFIDRLMKVVNQIRILGEELGDRRVVEKVLVNLPEKFEAKISSLEKSRDLNHISLSELVNALQATEQRRSIRQEETSESAFLALRKGKAPANNNQRKQQSGGSNVKGKCGVGTSREGERKKFTKCSYCKKDNHPEKYYWFRLNVQCRVCKQIGHIEKVCKNKGGLVQQAHQVQVADEAWKSEERLFVATCYVENGNKEAWLVDSVCTQHMIHDVDLFKTLDRRFVSKVQIGNGDFIQLQSKGEVAVETSTEYVGCIFRNKKFEVAEIFTSFKAMVESQAKCSIKVIRSDNGTEYIAQKFELKCKELEFNIS